MRDEAEINERKGRWPPHVDAPAASGSGDSQATAATCAATSTEPSTNQRPGRRRVHQVPHNEWLEAIQSQIQSKQPQQAIIRELPDTINTGDIHPTDGRRTAKLSREEWIRKLEAEIDNDQAGHVSHQPPPPAVLLDPAVVQSTELPSIETSPPPQPLHEDDSIGDVAEPCETVEMGDAPEVNEDDHVASPVAKSCPTELPVQNSKKADTVRNNDKAKSKSDKQVVRGRQKPLEGGTSRLKREAKSKRTSDHEHTTIPPPNGRSSKPPLATATRRSRDDSKRHHQEPAVTTSPGKLHNNMALAYEAILEQNEEMKRQLADQSQVLQLIRQRMEGQPLPVAPAALVTASGGAAIANESSAKLPRRTNNDRRSKLVPPGTIALAHSTKPRLPSITSTAAPTPDQEHRTQPHHSSALLPPLESPPSSTVRAHVPNTINTSIVALLERQPASPPIKAIRSSGLPKDDPVLNENAKATSSRHHHHPKSVMLTSHCNPITMTWHDCDELGQTEPSTFLPVLATSTVDERELVADSVDMLLESSTMLPLHIRPSVVR
ncbi:hypothetical protein AaE_001816 [Aphanomyces astaci]|uniref:Uncharacterized protein n=1 Tax=Aphanomyces astaci TaxID=112090 RepID=A0A6A5AVP3_APHAT|nr:hypothetical protein AaE_001816 [Aphanomyces astaci]